MADKAVANRIGTGLDLVLLLVASLAPHPSTDQCLAFRAATGLAGENQFGARSERHVWLLVCCNGCEWMTLGR